MAKRNQTVDALRAIAALWVCLWHFTLGIGIGAHGYLGVTIFFVISGFIVPHSMMRSGYTLAGWPTFMLKRLARLEPPYLASIVLTLALGAFEASRGFPPNWTASQIAGHLGYANAFLGLPWLNAPYWSLAVEFQFYIVMGLALPLLMRAGTPARRLAGLAVAAGLPLLVSSRSNATILPYLPVFAAGILTFMRVTDLIGRKSYWAALPVLGALAFKVQDAGVALATVGTAVLIATVRIPRVAPLAWLGAISYSLYLLHVPIGYRVMNVIEKTSSDALAPVVVGIVAIMGALAASIAGAALFRRYVEQPSLRLAARIGYRPTRTESSLPAPAPGEGAIGA